MQTPLISIIIPVYNVEKYLSECLDSVIAQTYQNWEAICVNDGSPDNCAEILNKYASKDNRIKVFSKPNGGLSDARNFGLKHTKGEYIAFLDSDDKWHPQLLDIANYLREQCNADLVNFDFFKDLGGDINYKKYTISDIQYNTTENPALIGTYKGKHRITFNVWSKLYKKELIDGLEFIPKIHFEDYPFTYAVLSRKPKTISTNTKLYFYRRNSNSISNQQENPQRIKDYHTGITYIYNIYNTKELKKELLVLKSNLIPSILKQQLKRCEKGNFENKNKMYKAFAEELIDLQSKGLIQFKGHKLLHYLMYKFLMKQYGE